MPKVLRIINRLNLGGPTYNAALLTKYLDSDFETMLVSGMRDETEESSEFIVKDLDLRPVYIPEMYRELNPLKDYKAYFKIREIIKQFKPDIVHTHAAKAGAIGRLAAAHCGVKVIVHTFHGHVFHSYFNPVKSKVFIGIEQYLAKHSTKIVTLSEIQKEELANQFKIAPAEKFKIINLGFDLSKFAENKEEKRAQFRAEFNVDADEIAIGIIGRFVPVKNHDLFLEALKIVSDKTTKKLRVFLIGDGELREAIEAKATALNLSFNNTNQTEKNILTFCSWRKDIDVTNAGCDLIALTSDNEGTPVSLIEAQASGKPIVSTNVGGIENIVKAGETALLSPAKDVQAFAENLFRLVENDSLRASMSGKGQDYVMKQFSYERLCKEMGTLYRELLSNKS